MVILGHQSHCFMSLPPIRLLLVSTALLAAYSLQARDPIEAAPFTPPSSPIGADLFSSLSPSQTGITVENPYDDPQMWAERYREFMGGGMGSGIAAGDFDGDGLVDLYVSTKTKPGTLYRNRGGWRFEDVTERAGLAEKSSSLFSRLKDSLSSQPTFIWRQGAVFADINNDGWLDLYVCRSAAPNLLYVNQGDGTFREEAAARGLAIVDGSVIGAFADYDRDGWLDVLVLTNQMEGNEPAGRPDRLFRNQGDGYFTEVTAAAGITGPTFGHAATWFDFDGDRWPDLYIANDFAGSDHFFHNNRDGTFTNVIHTVAPHTPYSSMGADTADINHDGAIDLLVADMATTTREKDRRGLAASRGDMLAASTRGEEIPQYMRNVLLLNTGRGVFGEAAIWAGLEATDWTWSVRFEDFDNDGWTDLHVTNGMVREANNSDLLTRMMSALSDLERIRVMRSAPPLNEANLAFRNLRGEGFEPVAAAWGLDETGVTFGAATADFDQDGDLDLVTLNYNGGVSVFRNDTSGAHRIQIRLQGTRSNRFGIGAVIRVESPSIGRQSRTLTVARGYASGSEIVAHFGLGNDERIARLVVEWPSGVTQEFTDLAADRRYVITETGSPAGDVSPAAPPSLFHPATTTSGLVLEDASTLALPDQEQTFLPFRTDRRGPGVAVADVDGDGHDDLYLGATTGSPARLLRWSNGVYQDESALRLPAALAGEEGPPLLLDLNGDGAVDLLTTRASARHAAWPEHFRPRIYANDGRGQFRPTDWLPPELALNVGAAAAADIDGDGDLDLFLGGRSIPGRYPEAPRSVILRNDAGRFIDATDPASPLAQVGLVKSALFRDLDRDGRPDLILALEWDFVRYFHNEGDGRFADWTERSGFASGGRGWWNSLASADFNGDGRLDLVVGNLGLNTIYRASPASPATLLYGDFAGNGTAMLMETVNEAGTLYPLRSRVDIAGQLPFILRKFRQNDTYARATLAEIVGERPVAQATAYQADTFSSGVFLSQPDGRYDFSPLPRLAQLGPIQGLVATDLDGDGFADVAAVQNSDAAVPRFDGGVGIILRGHGDGTFTALPPAASGLIVPGNGRALVVLDPTATGRPDLFLTRHGGSSALLTHQAPADWLELRLRGAAGNPDAVGAHITLRYADGRQSYHELGLGGGWWSQSAPALPIAIPAGTHLIAAEVRWPDGRQTRHTDMPARGRWTLQPEPQR